VRQDPESDQTASEQVVVEVGVQPSVVSVAALLRARTKVRGGGDVGTATSLTRPTDVESSALRLERSNSARESIPKVTSRRAVRQVAAAH
jgi:hypothetical protein